jgi:hypothetical protein
MLAASINKSRLHNMTEPTERCIGCGAMVPRIDGPTHRYMTSAPGCWAKHGEVSAHHLSDPHAWHYRQSAPMPTRSSIPASWGRRPCNPSAGTSSACSPSWNSAFLLRALRRFSTEAFSRRGISRG